MFLMSEVKKVWNNPELIKLIKQGGVAVIPTDTVYGIVGIALLQETVLRIYKIKGRDADKPCIILIGDISEIKKFHINISKEQKNYLNKIWKDSLRPISVILDCPSPLFAYLHRNTNTLAFRLPSNRLLREFLLRTGPLVAPSANIQNMPPAKNIKEAKKYFGNSVGLYIDGDSAKGTASRIVKLNRDGSTSIIRE